MKIFPCHFINLDQRSFIRLQKAGEDQKQRFYKVPLDADCSNSNVMHNFETGGWKKPDFIPRNLVKMIGGNVNKGRNESTKTNFSPV